MKSNTNLPRVSVLMPVYNVEKYVNEAVDSILAQSFTDFELIILDDCSTDGTADLVKEYADERIVYHCNEKNLGLANNLNVGLSLAKGELIARMDGDDISFPDRFRIQVDFLDKHTDIDLCSCGLQMFGTEDTIWVRESNLENIKITMMFYSPILHASSVWRRESFAKRNLYYDQNAFPAEDYDLWSRAIFSCKLVNIPEVLYKYRIHGIQVTKTDDRVAQKDLEIQTEFVKRALPTLSVSDVNFFINSFIRRNDLCIENVRSLKQIVIKLLEANNQSLFFQQKMLKLRLMKYYRALIFKSLQQQRISIQIIVKYFSLFVELKPRQIIKLFMFNTKRV